MTDTLHIFLSAFQAYLDKYILQRNTFRPKVVENEIHFIYPYIVSGEPFGFRDH
jgi:hypothetical protein